MLYKVVKCPTRQMALNADQNNIIYLNINSNYTTTIYKNYPLESYVTYMSHGLEWGTPIDSGEKWQKVIFLTGF